MQNFPKNCERSVQLCIRDISGHTDRHPYIYLSYAINIGVKRERNNQFS